MGGVKVRQPSGGQECSGRAECSTSAMQSRVAQSTGTPLAEPYGGVSAYGFSSVCPEASENQVPSYP